ncbi:MAG: asparagine synthase [Parcubacteria group bacterium Athens1014_10]|nr:MAG: asparagine synthase [Parcubacteria group bacterium Athens1014_10]TSD05533.1 MAG: asparagine synthase [Parcubacteria group bacterium Athens0714_12]
MCGITGFVGYGNEEILKKMTATLEHRGPDDAGFYFNGEMGLGHRRLSIIDLATGHQPVFNEDKTVAVIFNGEIYNFLDLKKELEKRHQFKTKSDTEVIIHLYEEKGESFLADLNGMFALALWDEKKKKLILGRDRMGQKPLYYSLLNQTLIFGSELKAILSHPLAKREIDFSSLAKYLTFEYIPSPKSIFKNINKLKAGEYLVYQSSKLEIKSYWDINFKFQIPNSKFQNCLQELDKKLEEAVKIRLMSDVPLGIFLSGGIDSSAIAYYAQKNSSQKIKTFSIGFEEKSFDESKYARQIAEFLNTEHYEKIFNSKDVLDLVPKVMDFLDEPLADTSILPTYLLSKFTREKVKVALGGDGGDELFMGYQTFQAHKINQVYQKFPRFFKKIAEKLIYNLPLSLDNISFDFQLKKFLSGADFPIQRRDIIWLGSFLPAQLSELFKPEILARANLENQFEEADNYYQKIKGHNFYNQIIYLYQKFYLQDDILTKVDRASMANGLEARAPFLDYHLVEFINSIKWQYKLKGFEMKYIFKKLMENKLPKNIINRPKKGFGIPMAKWINNELKEFTLNLLSKEKIDREGFFNYSFIVQILKEHFSRKKDNRKLIWTLLVFEMWLEKWER